MSDPPGRPLGRGPARGGGSLTPRVLNRTRKSARHKAPRVIVTELFVERRKCSCALAGRGAQRTVAAADTDTAGRQNHRHHPDNPPMEGCPLLRPPRRNLEMDEGRSAPRLFLAPFLPQPLYRCKRKAASGDGLGSLSNQGREARCWLSDGRPANRIGVLLSVDPEPTAAPTSVLR